MEIYFAVFIVCFIMAYIARKFPVPCREGPFYERPRWFGYFLVALLFSLVAGFRSGGVGDTGIYLYYYKIPLETGFWHSIDHALHLQEPAYSVFTVILKTISMNPVMFTMATSIITCFLFIRTIWKYTDYFEMGVVIFFCYDFYMFALNGIRQFLASAIIFAGIKWLLNGNWAKYFILVLFASAIHSSAIFMIPIYFLVHRRAWSLGTSALLVIGVGLFTVFPLVLPQLANMLSDTAYSKYTGDLLESSAGGGSNYIRVLIAAVPMALAYLSRRRLHDFWPQSDIIVNMSIMNFLILLVSTYNWLVARLAFYTIPFNALLVPLIISKSFEGRTKKVMYLVTTILFVAYGAFQGFWFAYTYESDFLGIYTEWIYTRIMRA